MSKREGGFSGGLAYMVSDDERGQPDELYSVLRHADGWHVAMERIPGPDDAIAARIESWGGVSVRLQPSGAGMTTEAVDADGLVFCFSQETDGSPTLVFGLVADHIRTVDVAWLQESRPASVENNAFAALVDAHPDDLVGLVLHRADGTSVRAEI